MPKCVKCVLTRAAVLIAVVALSVNIIVAASPVKVEKTKYSHYGECYKLTNGVVDVIVTTDIGPRVIAYRFIGGTNMFAEMTADAAVKTAFGEWHPWGGHRLWAAPEVMPRSYWPDNSKVAAEVVGGDTVRVVPPTETGTHLQKEMLIKLNATGTGVTVTHKITNKDVWPIEIAPWALTIMNGGGTTIIPQEPFISHDDRVLPARAMVLWNFTDMSDPRYTFGKKYVRLRTDEKLADPQKIGVADKLGWAGYLREKTLFVKRFPYIENANYPDYGCNFETYTAGTFMEVESLGPLTKMEPGETATHVERWFLFDNVDAGSTEESLDKAISPLVSQTQH